MGKFDDFKGHLKTLYHELQSYNYRDNSVLPRKDATEDEVRGLYDEFDEIRVTLYDSFLEFAEVLQNNTTNDQFLVVSKKVAQMF